MTEPTAPVLPPLCCEVCDDEPAVGVAAVPGVSISVAYGRRCLDANAHPWWVIVGNTAAIGGLDQAAAWWVRMVEATMRLLGKTRADLDRDVADLNARAEVL
jgi:hypothetical protein